MYLLDNNFLKDKVNEKVYPYFQNYGFENIIQMQNTEITEILHGIDWDYANEHTTFLTHDIHPYPAKFIPHLPGKIMSIFSNPGDLVFDPFGGSGTTALEASRMQRRALSFDANPIGTLVGKVKTITLNDEILFDIKTLIVSIISQIERLPVEPKELINEFYNFIPEIPNIDKWFPITARGELGYIKSRIQLFKNEDAKSIARLAISKIILSVSFQDSETRYVSKPKQIIQGETLKKYLKAVNEIVASIKETNNFFKSSLIDFKTIDIKKVTSEVLCDNNVDLIITSPPYGNAMDYHLYHRFRLFWLDEYPKDLQNIEIGSHLRHQKEKTGYDSYFDEMKVALNIMYRVLKPSRFAIIIVGDSIYEKKHYDNAKTFSQYSKSIGFEVIEILKRNLPRNKRSFTKAGRRADQEKILVLRKPTKNICLEIQKQPYKLWAYERLLNNKEIAKLLELDNKKIKERLVVSSELVDRLKKATFIHGIKTDSGYRLSTWQSILENGSTQKRSNRKDPKYATHGLHPYKGKFYPQLAKTLMNLYGKNQAMNVFDPFCGSGTTILESYLNGHIGYGIDMNPLASKIASTKVGILKANIDTLTELSETLVKRLKDFNPNVNRYSAFHTNCADEIDKWFAPKIIAKLNYLLHEIRIISTGIYKDFFEIVYSSIIRSVSHQDVTDLRIRKRKKLLDDIDVFSIFQKELEVHIKRIIKFWRVRNYAPNEFHDATIINGDSRDKSNFLNLNINNNIDLILTSPPYATALPYIDTDRLSILLLFGLNSSERRPLEHELTGTREINNGKRNEIEKAILSCSTNLPPKTSLFIEKLYHDLSKDDVGFRRANMPALLVKFFKDIRMILGNSYDVLKTNANMMIILGENRIKVFDVYRRIPTIDFVEEIGESIGYKINNRISISVTTENLKHVKNSITENSVLHFSK